MRTRRILARCLGLAVAVGLGCWAVRRILLPLRPRLSAPTAKGWGSHGFDAYASAWYRLNDRVPRQPPAQHVAFQSLRPVPGVGNGVFTGDIDADGTPEIVCKDADGHDLLVYRPTAQRRLALVARHRMPKTWDLYGITNVDADPADEVLVTWRRGRGLRLAFLRLTPRRLSVVRSVNLVPHFLLATPADRLGLVKAIRLRIVDLDGDKAPEVLVGWDFILSGTEDGHAAERRDRRIAIHDLRTGEERWSYPLGPFPDRFAVGDLDGDGVRDVVFGCYAISNGLESNGTDDSHSYVIALSGKGGLLWRTPPLGGYFTGTGVSLAQLTGDGRPEVVAALEAAYPHRGDRGALYVLDPRTGAIRRRYEGAYGLYTPAVGDVLGNSRLEIVTGGRDGVIRVFDARLRLLRTLVARAPTSVQALADLDQDGKAEIVGLTADRRLVVADCSPGYPAPTLSEFQLGVSTRPAVNPNGLVVVSHVLAGPRPQLIAVWVKEGSRPEGAMRVIETCPAERPVLAGDPAAVTRTGGRAVEFVWSRTGARMALISAAGVKRTLAVVSPDGSVRRVLATQAGLTAPCWGGDDRLCVLRTGSQSAGGKFGELLIFGTRSGDSGRTVKGGVFGPPVWDRQSKRWVCIAKEEKGWSVCAIAPDGSVETLVGPQPAPLGDRIACLGGRRVIVSRSVVHRVPKPNPEDAVFHRTQLYCLDLDSSKSAPLVDVASLKEALTSGGQGFQTGVVAEWLSELQDLLPGVSAADKDARGRTIPRSVPIAVSPSGHSAAFPLTIARYFRPEAGKTTGGWVGTSPHDLWVWNAATRLLQRVTSDDDAFETNPTWSPDGQWLAYEVERQDLVRPTREIWISVPGRPGGSRLCAGHSPRWRPGGGDGRELAFLREGEVWTARVREPSVSKPPLYESAVVPYALGGVTGLLLTVLALGLRLHDRLRALLGAARLTVQAAMRSRAEVLLRELVRITDAAETTLHSLKNMVLLLPPLSAGAEQIEESLSYVLTEENVSAVSDLTEMALQTIRRLADIRGEVEAALTALPAPVAESYGRAVQVLLRERSGLEARAHQLRQLAKRFAQRDKMEESDRRNFVQHAYAEVESFYRWLVDEDSGAGLFDIVRRASDPLLVGAVVKEAAAGIESRAKDLGVSITVEGAQSRARAPGDPTLLRQVLQDLLDNALDAVARRAETEGGRYRGAISLSVSSDSDMGLTRIIIEDTGSGIDDEVLERLRRGEPASTKGEGRGVGLVNARRALARYPGGGIDIQSRGPGKGCLVTIFFEGF